MSFLSIRSPGEQVADHLREELDRGTWSREMPGTPQLAEDLGIDRKTITAALNLLEREGRIISQGPGRPRRIQPSAKKPSGRLRIALLPLESADRNPDYIVELQHELAAAEHRPFFTRKCMLDLGMDIRRITRLVRSTEADAWITIAPPRDLLEWFVRDGKPVFALFGRRRGLPVASVGPDKPPAVAAATRRLIALGHRRIVLLARAVRRLPKPGASEQAFLRELETHGIQSHGVQSSAYHLPEWPETVEGFHARLESLFAHTAPTALIIDETHLFIAAQQFLGNRGLRVPGDVSMICTDSHPSLDWCQPSVAHIRWATRPVVRRIVRWANHVSQGKDDRRLSFTPAEFVEGGTIGRARRQPRKSATVRQKRSG